MPVKQAHYEELLAEYSEHAGAIALLKEFRPYLEMLPSMRRPDDSLITIPLPVVRLRHVDLSAGDRSKPNRAIHLPCDIGILMCDPEWKVKTGVEIFVFIHRPEEDFSNLLGRWRQTQVLLDQDYEWVMPDRYGHLLSENAEGIHPLFVVFPETPDRIKRGLRGAALPYVIQAVYDLEEAFTPMATLSVQEGEDERSF